MSADLVKTFPKPDVPAPAPAVTARLVVRGDSIDHERLDALVGVASPQREAGVWSVAYKGAVPDILLTRMLSELPGSSSPIWTELRTRHQVHIELGCPDTFALSDLVFAELARIVPRVVFSVSG